MKKHLLLLLFSFYSHAATKAPFELQEKRAFFEQMIAREEPGFIGYHCSHQPYRIYQDIIRMVVEEKLGFKVPSHFHFLRIPGDPALKFSSLEELFAHHPPTWGHHVEKGLYDLQPEVQHHILSLNPSLYSNYNIREESSITPFTSEIDEKLYPLFTHLLEPFFISLGLPAEAIPELFALGLPLIEKSNALLIQIFDRSKEGELTKKFLYKSLRGGQLDTSIGPPTQLRLFIEASKTLNPQGFLHIHRFDGIDEEIIADYEAKLRNAIRRLPSNEKQIEVYRKQLINYWQYE